MMAASLEPRPAKSGIMAALPQDNSMHDIAATTRLNERAIAPVRQSDLPQAVHPGQAAGTCGRRVIGAKGLRAPSDRGPPSVRG